MAGAFLDPEPLYPKGYRVRRKPPRHEQRVHLKAHPLDLVPLRVITPLRGELL